MIKFGGVIIMIFSLSLWFGGCASKEKSDDESKDLILVDEGPSSSRRIKREEKEFADDEDDSDGDLIDVDDVERVAGQKELKILEEQTPDQKDYAAFSKALKLNNHQRILSQAQKILSKDSKNIRAINGLAMHYFNIGRPGMAKTILQRGLKEYPNSAVLYNNFGVISLSEKNWEAAVEAFKKALSLQRDNRAATFNLAVIYTKFYEFEKAMPHLKRVYEADPKDSLAAVSYSVALRGLGQKSTAFKVLAKVAQGSKEPMVLYNFALTLIEDFKKPEKGLKVLSLIKDRSNTEVLVKVTRLERQAREMVR